MWRSTRLKNEYMEVRNTLVITELKWILDNRDKLDDEDYKNLQSYDLFNQYDNGELHQNGLKMVEALGLVGNLYLKYNNLL